MPLAYLLCTLSSQRLPTELNTVKIDTERVWLVTYLAWQGKVEGEILKHGVRQFLVVNQDANFCSDCLQTWSSNFVMMA